MYIYGWIYLTPSKADVAIPACNKQNDLSCCYNTIIYPHKKG
nr:MAG TPA: hypothetical protein [Caudoviricetes sp.]